MSIWRFLRNLIGTRPKSDHRTFEISESIHASISTLAQHDGRPEHELVSELLVAGLNEYSSNERQWKIWETLTPREQEVTAFICLGYTNGEIAARLGITEAGTKFHVHNVLSKFEVSKRSKLRQILAHWDFGAYM